MNLPHLPHDLFLFFTDYLSPRDLIRCRRVSRTFHTAFTRQDTSLAFLLRYYPRCRELRLARALDGVTCLPNTEADGEVEEDNFAVLLTLSIEAERKNGRDWAGVFARVARRYWFLDTARVRVVEKVKLAVQKHPPATSATSADLFMYRPPPVFHPLYRFSSLPSWPVDLSLNPTVRFRSLAREWTYGVEDALLLYAAQVPSADWKLRDGQIWDGPLWPIGWDSDDYKVQPSVFVAPRDGAAAWTDESLVRCPYRMRDLETGLEVVVPFNIDGKFIRGLRLVSGVLVLEWAGLPICGRSYDTGAPRYRHTASIFDVVRVRYSKSSSSSLSSTSSPTAGQQQQPSPPPLWSWSIRWRRDIDMHPDGLPMRERFTCFSTHNAQHYALYLRMAGSNSSGDIESLVVWDITGDGHKNGELSALTTMPPPPPPPQPPQPPPLCRLSGSDLDFASVGRSNLPQLRGLELDDHNIYFVEEDYCWPPGPHAPFGQLPRSHLVRTVGIPIIPMPAAAGGASPFPLPPLLPPPPTAAPPPPPLIAANGRAVHGPVWQRACGVAGPRLTFCELRGLEPDPIFNLSGSGNDIASTTISPPLVQPDHALLRTGPCFAWQPPSSRDGTPQTHQSLSSSLGAYPFANQRPVAAPPCWRHDHFPHLTESEVVDAAAGIRFAARDSYLLSRRSVHLKPVLTVRRVRRRRRPGGNDDEAAVGAVPWDDDLDLIHLDDNDPAPAADGGSVSGDGDGVSIDDPLVEMELDSCLWNELMGRGRDIAGDERWIVGQDIKGDITIARF